MVVEQLRQRDIVDPVVIAAFAQVPRDLFVPAELVDRAYDDAPLPIGNGPPPACRGLTPRTSVPGPCYDAPR